MKTAFSLTYCLPALKVKEKVLELLREETKPFPETESICGQFLVFISSSKV
jgi:hypothetical protein